MSVITGVWHDEFQRWQQTGRLDQGPCWCAECIASESAPTREDQS